MNLTKEYPVLGGILYWMMSPFVRPDDLRQTILVHAAFMTVADLVNAAIFYRLAREIAPRWAFAATLALGLNLTAIVTAPVRYESWIVTFVLLGLRRASAPPVPVGDLLLVHRVRAQVVSRVLHRRPGVAAARGRAAPLPLARRRPPSSWA